MKFQFQLSVFLREIKLISGDSIKIKYSLQTSKNYYLWKIVQ